MWNENMLFHLRLSDNFYTCFGVISLLFIGTYDFLKLTK